MGTDTTLDAAAALQKEKAAARMQLITRLYKATESAVQLDELLTDAKRVRKAAPPDLTGPLDEVVEAATRAAAAAGQARAAAWKDATAGGWAARELRQLGMSPVRPRRDNTADRGTPGSSASDGQRTAVPSADSGQR
ncbi:hypothetical protein [Amycolatopsis sp. NPDC051102]|uniref:hypothetical protein n=1 Tax=Amycolatopsis sp. NPDC051102 TaxID=3155163 RepID=UPI0034136E67